ncbi:MAG: hypothetical protein ABIX28_20010, partial [Vicinamibacterales bacterium]
MRVRDLAVAAVFGIGAMSPARVGAQAAAAPAQSAGRAVPADAAVAVSTAIEATARVAGAAVVEIFTMSYAPTEGRVAGTTDLVRTQRASVESGVLVLGCPAHVSSGQRARR